MGVGRLIFPPEGVEICGDAYLSLLEKEVAPDIKFRTKARSDPKKRFWQQDLAPAHTKKSVLSKLESGKLVPKNLPWPPKGADVSPLDYGIWSWFDQKLDEYREHTEISNESDLRAALNDIHSKIPQEMVGRTMGARPSRLDLPTESDGRRFERKKNNSFFLSPCARVCFHTPPRFVNNKRVNNVCLGRTDWRTNFLICVIKLMRRAPAFA